MTSHSDRSGKDRLHVEIHGPAVTRETTQRAGENMVALMEEVGRAMGFRPLGWRVADVVFKCDGCKQTQPFEAPRDGWVHREGDDFCPVCAASDEGKPA